MAPFSKRSRNRANQSWSQPDAVPTRSGLEASSNYKRQKFYRWIARLSIVSYPFVFLLLILTFGNTLNHTTSSSSAADTVPEEVKAAATTEITTWLSDTKANALPGASLHGLDRCTVVPQPALSKNDEKQVKAGNKRVWTIYNCTFMVSTDQVDYSAGVQVNYDKSLGVQVIGDPSLQILSSESGNWSEETWPGTEVAAPADYKLAVDAWSQAYTSGDTDALTAAVADPNGKHVYAPLTGIASQSASINRAAFLPVAKAGDEPDKSVAIANVTITYVRDGSDEQSKATISLDVLIANANSGSARVVAWGPTGSGPTLKAYSNALPSGYQAAQSESTATATPTAESTH